MCQTGGKLCQIPRNARVFCGFQRTDTRIRMILHRHMNGESIRILINAARSRLSRLMFSASHDQIHLCFRLVVKALRAVARQIAN